MLPLAQVLFMGSRDFNPQIQSSGLIFHTSYDSRFPHISELRQTFRIDLRVYNIMLFGVKFVVNLEYPERIYAAVISTTEHINHSTILIKP